MEKRMDPAEFDDDAPGVFVPTETAQGKTEAYVPEPLPPDFDRGALINDLADAVQAIGRLTGIGPRVGSNRILIEPFLRKEAVESSQIEGTKATLSDIYAYEAGEQDLIADTSRDDAKEVANYLEALEYGLEAIDRGEQISVELLCEMHERLMKGVRGGEARPGEIRTSQNWIGPANVDHARHVPPPPDQVQECLEELVAHINTGYTTHPLLRIGMIHYQFETIHPFLDGNGRLGRLLITLLTLREELLPGPYLYLSSYFNRRKGEYVDRMLKVSKYDEWVPWLQFFLEGVRDQADEAHMRADLIVDLREDYQQRYVDERSSNLQRLVMLLFEHPYLDAQDVQEWLDVSRDTAHRLVNRLEADGVLEELTGKQRNQFYRAQEIFEIIDLPIGTLMARAN
jgi:Fic family protein